MRKSVKLNKILKMRNGEIVVLQELFDYGDGFKGATGCSIAGHSQEYVDDRNEIATVIEYLKDSVDKPAGYPTFREWAKACIQEATYSGQDFPFQDDSYISEIGADKLNAFLVSEGLEEAAAFECVGGGRMFETQDEEAFFLEYGHLLEEK